MEDIGKVLYERVKANFDRRCKDHYLIKTISKRIANGKADMIDLSSYAGSLGAQLANAILDEVTQDLLPDGRLYYNIAKSIIEPMLRGNYDLINSVADELQASLDRKLSYRIKAQHASFPQERVNTAIGAASQEGIDWETVRRRMSSTPENITHAMADDYMKANAEFRSKAGIDTYIERKDDGKCCEWCSKLAGRYRYPEQVPRDVFRRHDNCGCLVSYVTPGGMRQNVHTKRDWSDEDQREYLKQLDEDKKRKREERKARWGDSYDKVRRERIVFSPKEAAEREKIVKEKIAEKRKMALTNVSKSDIIYASELGSFRQKVQSDKRVDKNYYAALKNRFSHGSDSAKKAFNKFVPSNSVADSNYMGTPHFHPEDNKIYMNYLYDLYNPRGSGVTWFHEHGHLIDTLAGELSKNQDFISLIKSDYKNTVQAYIRKYKVNEQSAYALIGKDVSEIRKHSAVSDLLNGLSENQIIGVSKHEPNYWKNDNVFGKEAFAHMYEAQFDEVRYKEMKKYFPNALQRFEDILGGVVK